MHNEYAVKISDLTVAYDEKPVLWDIELEIPKGKLAAVIGPNGAGKSTLMKAMLGLVKPLSGNIYIHQDPICPFQKKKKLLSVGYVPQSESVDWEFPATVLDIVLMGRYGKLGWFKRPKKHDKLMAEEMLERVGMKSLAHRQISQLSGGQQQRVFLARALVQQADIYFLDEPFKGVDVKTEKSIITQLKELRNQGKTVIVVHHDLNTVPDYFDWVTLINMRIVANGGLNTTFTEENLLKTFYHKLPSLTGGSIHE